MQRNTINRIMSGTALVALAVTQSHAEEAVSGGESEMLMEEVVVSGSRLPNNLSTMPGSVLVVDEAEMAKQLRTTGDLEGILGQLVPGMGTSSASPANFTTSLRGRKPVFFIDGVPITDTLNDVGRELRMIDPSVIGRIEVVKGASALYGNSAGSGFINYITASGDKDETKMFTEVGMRASLSKVGEGFRPSIRQGLSGGSGKIDYRVVGYYEKTSGFFDAAGDRIAPIPNGASGLADSRIYSLFGKIGFDVTDEQRVEVMVNHYDQEQDTEYTLLPGDVSEGIKAAAIKKDPADTEESNQFHRNTVATMSYSHSDILGSVVRAQLFYQKNTSVFGFSANRFVLTDKPSGQSDTNSEKYGARLDINTPLTFLNDSSQLLWGVDYMRNESLAGLVDGRQFSPPVDLKSRAAFAQLQFSILNRFTITAGVRYEEADLDVADFDSLLTLKHVVGGTLKYDATPVNLGITYDLTDNVNLYAGFSQGFEVASVTRPLRSYPVDVNVNILQPKPNLIDNYEVGFRGQWDNFSTSFAVYYATSSNGLSLSPDPVNPAESVVENRTADEVYGFEWVGDVVVSDRLNIGASYSYMEGREDRDGDGEYERPMQHRRIAPSKFTGYVDYDLGNTWNVRLQGLYSGSRLNRFPGSTAFYEGQIESWFTLDVSASGEVGPGTLSIGVNNALNHDHYTHLSAAMQQDNRYSKAPGATISTRYRIDY